MWPRCEAVPRPTAIPTFVPSWKKERKAGPTSSPGVQCQSQSFHRQDSGWLNLFYFHYTEPEERDGERKTERGRKGEQERRAKLKDSRSPAYTPVPIPYLIQWLICSLKYIPNLIIPLIIQDLTKKKNASLYVCVMEREDGDGKGKGRGHFPTFFCNRTNIRTKANTHRHTWSHLRIFGPERVMYKEM